jgi:hypothetical protein
LHQLDAFVALGQCVHTLRYGRSASSDQGEFAAPLTHALKLISARPQCAMFSSHHR